MTDMKANDATLMAQSIFVQKKIEWISLFRISLILLIFWGWLINFVRKRRPERNTRIYVT